MKINQGILFGDIIWDKEDLEVDGNAYFTYDEALKFAAERGKRLPTADEARSIALNPKCIVYENPRKDNSKVNASKVLISLPNNKEISFNFNGYVNSFTNKFFQKFIYCIYWCESSMDGSYNLEKNVFFYNTRSSFGRDRFGVLARCSVRLVKDI